VRGDVLAVACDAVIVPTDRAGNVEPPWRAHLESLDGVVIEREVVQLDGQPGGVDPVAGPFMHRSPGGTARGNSEQQTWLVASGVLPSPGEIGPDDHRWRSAIDELRTTLMEFARRFRSTQGPRPPRGCPLVGVPLLGSAAGGFRDHFRQYASELLDALRDAAASGGFDVVLVIYGAGERAVAEETLCRLERAGLPGLMPTTDELAARWRLGDVPPGPAAPTTTRGIKTSLETLLEKAASGDLIPFFGAGVSRSAGAAGWGELVAALEERAGLTDLAVEGIDLLSRAQIVEHCLGTDRLHKELAVLLGEARVSLQHLLMAALGARDAITTNFDDAYERAVEDAGRGPVAVVPHPGSDLRLLKLHGSLARARPHGGGVEAGTDVLRGSSGGALRPILTRDQFIEHERENGPLRGALQMMLLTGHVLFIGYSLSDPDLHAAIHEVRRIRKSADIATNEPLATALQVEPSRELSYLWAGTVSVLWPSNEDASQEGGHGGTGGMQPRELEILLDALADAANTAELPVLAFSPHELSDTEQQLADHLTSLRAHFGDGRLPASISALLRAYGADDLSSELPS
jgi:hypothetical protein